MLVPLFPGQQRAVVMFQRPLSSISASASRAASERRAEAMACHLHVSCAEFLKLWDMYRHVLFFGRMYMLIKSDQSVKANRNDTCLHHVDRISKFGLFWRGLGAHTGTQTWINKECKSAFWAKLLSIRLASRNTPVAYAPVSWIYCIGTWILQKVQTWVLFYGDFTIVDI